MRLSLVVTTVGLATSTTARFLPRLGEKPGQHLSDLAPRDLKVSSIEQDESGAVPLFESEKDHLTADNSKLPEILHFASCKVGEADDVQIDYTLRGPDNCKIFPGDKEWPSNQKWAILNNATGNALLKPIPQAHICYDNTTASAACRELTDGWKDPFSHIDDPIEMLSPLYQGQTCQPPSIFDESGECTQGGYPLYVVKATNVAQIQLAVNFARNTGIRLVIKNTGHDFSGKSGGAGSLSVWTHHLKDIAYIPDYEDCEYSGRAMKAGVGVQGFELYTAANNLGLVAMGGECPTVGILGGWVQGGGHSPLGSIYGMGADHVLGFEVVTADGRFVTANANENTDLFWALRGGGGGDYGIVTSVIFKVYEDLPVTTASWTFTSGENVTDKAFSAGLKAWFEMLPSNVDNGVYTYFQVFNLGTSKMFIMTPWFAANKSIDESKELLQPWLARMSELNIPVVPEWKSYDGFYEAYNKSFPVESVMPAATATAARFFRRENFIKEDLLDETFDTFWRHIENGQALMGFNLGPTWTRGGEPDNSVNPAWRDAVLHLITAVSLDTTESVEYQMEQRLNFTNGPMKEWRDLTPGGGGYMSEGDRLEPNFQWNFFGSFYPRLLEIKQRYDPFNLFYAHRAVGSEFFEVRGETVMSDENGRLCVKENPTHYQAEGPDWVPQ